MKGKTLASQLLERVRKLTTKAIAEYSMIEAGDTILVAISGGKDSALLYLILREIQKRSKLSFSLKGVMLDQKQPGFSPEQFLQWMDNNNLPVELINEDTHSIVKEKTAAGKSFCGLCSRLRRGILDNYAHKHGFTKIALGHHQDDLNETLLMNLFHNGRIAAMPPKLLADDHRNTVIRPLCYVQEKSLQELTTALAIPVIPCNLCGSQENMQRSSIKKVLQELVNISSLRVYSYLNTFRTIT